MSKIFGGMRQLAFVVRDLDSAVRHWTQKVGVGPFFVLSNVEFLDYRYRGSPAPSPQLDIALSWSGAFQIEIIEQLNDAPSAYADFLSAGREGMHHVCAWYDSADGYDAGRRKALSSGASLVHEGAMGSAQIGTIARFAYFATDDSAGGFYFEISEGLIPALRPFIDMIEQVTGQWTGEDPIRRLG